MFTAKHWINRIGLALTATVLAFNLSVAHAVVITATTTFDDGTDTGFSFGPISGSFNLVSGGATTTSTYSDYNVTGANPLTGPLTVINDGSGFTGTASATDGEFAIGFDTDITVLNDTSSTQTVVFRLEYSNFVNADGGDAYADSELTLSEKLVGDMDFTEVFFSDLISDTSFGDEVGGVLTGAFGEELNDSGNQLFSYMLNPSDEILLRMSWTLNGGDFAPGGIAGLAEADLTANLTLVPLPGSLLLMLSGLLLLPMQRLMRR